MALADVLARLSNADASYRGLIAAGVHVFAAERPMTRVRSYQTAVLSPIGARGMPKETLLLAHVHEDAGGSASAIEGFNGAEGERLAERIRAAVVDAGLLAPGAVVQPAMPLRLCPHSQRRIPPPPR